MKFKHDRLAFSLIALLLAGAVSCAKKPTGTCCPPMPGATGTTTAGIPERPEKLSFPALTYESPAPEKFRVQLKSGPVAYVVPDRELPLVNFSILVRTGDYLDPDGKEGLANLTGYLLARGGIKSKSAEELEERLAFLAAQLNASIADSQGGVSLNLLSKDLDEGLAILREVLTTPRFQEDKLTLRKKQMIQFMKQRNDESSAIEGREANRLAYGENFFNNRYSTAASVETITRADLEAFHQKWFVPANFIVAVNGDFDRADMIARLEKLFADWPFQGETPPPVPSNPTFAEAGVYLVDKDVNQGRVSIMLPGIKRDNPDYFPIIIMNDILGGGGFTSRIMNRVRSDEGLAYSVNSRFEGGAYYADPWRLVYQTKVRSTPYATQIALEEIRKIRDTPVTQEELDTAMNSFIVGFPSRFGTANAIAGALAAEEMTGRYARDPGWFGEYAGRIGAVTLADVQRVAQRLLDPAKMTFLFVGNAKEMSMGDGKHDVTLVKLAGGEPKALALRDPATMKPLP